MAALLNGGSTAAETAAASDASPSPSSSDEREREGKAEGRFFLKDKLCALGLASVSILERK